MTRILALAMAATVTLGAPAMAAPEHVRVRGTVTTISDHTLTVKTTAGTETTVALDDKTRFLKVVKSSLDKVEKDSYIGTATKTVGQQLIALEVVVFPPAMKGAGEGHYAWDKIPDTTLSGSSSTASSMTNGSVTAVAGQGAAVNSSMTNGTVSTAAAQGGVKKLTVTYKGGEQTILVPPTAPIVSFQPGAISDVTTGATVFVNATEDDGKITANSVGVGTDGVKPPM